MAENQYSIAFIGAGNMTSEHIKAFADISEVKLAGIYSRTRKKSENIAFLYPGMIVCDSIDELFSKLKPNLVVISVPELSTESVCLEAFKYPWTCLIEKPVGYNYENAEIILEAARKNNSKAYVALNRRHHSSTLNVLKDMATVNQPRVINIYDQENPNAALIAGQPELVVENWMYANSIHMIDYFSILGRGKVITIENIIKWNPKAPDFVLSKLTYDSGDIGIYQAVWNAPGPWAVVVSTQQKRWEMRPLEQASVQFYGSRKQEPFEVHPWDKDFKPGLRIQAQQAINAVKGVEHTLPTLDDAMESMKLVKAFYFGV
jgi:predicted dehydrogenase